MPPAAEANPCLSNFLPSSPMSTKKHCDLGKRAETLHAETITKGKPAVYEDEDSTYRYTALYVLYLPRFQVCIPDVHT